MKKIIIAIGIAFVFTACNNEANDKDSVEKADSANEVKQEQTPAAIQVNEATSNFLVNAADGGLAEVEAGKLGEEKAQSPAVKRFAAMMVHDHTGANAEVKALAAARNISLPSSPSEDNKSKAAKIAEKSGKDFDKAYMDMMVDDHEKTINLFEKGLDNSNDNDVKSFITNTLPKLKMHLDSAQAIRKMVKK